MPFCTQAHRTYHERMNKRKAVQSAAPRRRTINLPEKAHAKLDRLTLKARSITGRAVFKQEIVARMIDHFDAHPEDFQVLMTA